MSKCEYTRTTSVDISKWFRQYVVKIGYVEKYRDIHPISVIRKLDNLVIKKHALEGNIIRKAFYEKRNEIWCNLFPDNVDYKLGAIKEQYEIESQWFGIFTFILLGTVIYYMGKYLVTLVGLEWSEMIMFIPAFFAVFIINPSRDWYMRYSLQK